MKSEPEILYKYRSLSGDNFKFTHDIFMKNELYFPHPDQINDPFDCKIPPYLDNLTKEDVIEFVKKVDPKKVEDRVGDFDKWKQGILNASLSEIVKSWEQGLKSQQDVGVLSFSKKYSDILMWAHYADSHKGICIGFDSCELSFTFRGMPLPPEQVKYPKYNEYPKWNPFDVIEVTPSSSEEICDILYFTKSRDWKYEEEWRIIFPANGRTLQKINPNALVSVHFGCQIAKDDKETVINWCLQREQKPKVYEMMKDDTSYSLKENEISY